MLSGKSYYNSNVFHQPITFVHRDLRYGEGTADFEFIYKPVLDFSGDWLDPFGFTVTFGASSNSDYETEGTHGAETIFLSHDASLGDLGKVRARVVTSLGSRDQIVTYNLDTRVITIPYVPSVHSKITLTKVERSTITTDPVHGKRFNVTTFEYALNAGGSWTQQFGGNHTTLFSQNGMTLTDPAGRTLEFTKFTEENGNLLDAYVTYTGASGSASNLSWDSVNERFQNGSGSVIYVPPALSLIHI